MGMSEDLERGVVLKMGMVKWKKVLGWNHPPILGMVGGD